MDNTTGPITLISVAVKQQIQRQTISGKTVYCVLRDRDDLQQHIRLLLHAILLSKCTAVVLSALGCGLGDHPPEEVALLFKREIYRVGQKLPYIYFAIYNENQEPDTIGNFEIFNKILVNEADDPSWLSGYDVWMNHLVATIQADFPKAMLGDAGGSGANRLQNLTKKTKQCCRLKLVTFPWKLVPVDLSAVLLRRMRNVPMRHNLTTLPRQLVVRPDHLEPVTFPQRI